jgi:hypothetical protein
LYEVAPSLTDGTVVLDVIQPEDADSHLAGEDEEQARRFGWFSRRSTLASVRETIARWRDQWLTQGPALAFALRLAAIELEGIGADGSTMYRWSAERMPSASTTTSAIRQHGHPTPHEGPGEKRPL